MKTFFHILDGGDHAKYHLKSIFLNQNSWSLTEIQLIVIIWDLCDSETQMDKKNRFEMGSQLVVI